MEAPEEPLGNSKIGSYRKKKKSSQQIDLDMTCGDHGDQQKREKVESLGKFILVKSAKNPMAI